MELNAVKFTERQIFLNINKYPSLVEDGQFYRKCPALKSWIRCPVWAWQLWNRASSISRLEVI